MSAQSAPCALPAARQSGGMRLKIDRWLPARGLVFSIEVLWCRCCKPERSGARERLVPGPAFQAAICAAAQCPVAAAEPEPAPQTWAEVVPLIIKDVSAWCRLSSQPPSRALPSCLLPFFRPGPEKRSHPLAPLLRLGGETHLGLAPEVIYRYKYYIGLRAGCCFGPCHGEQQALAHARELSPACSRSQLPARGRPQRWC